MNLPVSEEDLLSSTASFLCESITEVSRGLGVDAVDALIILCALQGTEDRPRSMSAVGRQLGLARETARRRVQALQAAGFFVGDAAGDQGLALRDRADVAAVSALLADMVLHHAQTWRRTPFEGCVGKEMG